MQLSFKTLCVLADSGDDDAEEAVRNWLYFAKENTNSNCKVVAHFGRNTTRRYHVCLTMEKNKNAN